MKADVSILVWFYSLFKEQKSMSQVRFWFLLISLSGPQHRIPAMPKGIDLKTNISLLYS